MGNGFRECNAINDLGVLVDSRLSFDHQCDSVVRKASGVLNLIFRTFKCHDVVFLKRMFCSYVLPIIDYGFVIYHPHTKGFQKVMEVALWHPCL